MATWQRPRFPIDAPVNTRAPELSGAAQVAEQLSVSAGEWTEDGITLDYWWLADGVIIEGENASTFTVGVSQEGASLQAVVAATNNGGTAYSFSPETSVALPPVLPINLTLPVITGTLEVGGVLTVSDGTWSGNPTVFTYEWFLDDVLMVGETADTLTLTDDEYDGYITATVTATNGSGSTEADAAQVGPVADADPYWENVVLLVGCNGTNGSKVLTDEATAKTISIFGDTGAALDTSVKKFGTASLKFPDFVNDGWSVPDSADWQFTGEFTIELWFRPDGGNNLLGLLTQWAGGSASNWRLSHFYGGAALQNIVFGYSATGNSANEVSISTPNMSIDNAVFHHIAVTRDTSNVIRLFLNGVQQASATSNFSPNVASELVIGRINNSFASCPRGWLDEIRITKGVCRYAANFTPRTRAFPRG